MRARMILLALALGCGGCTREVAIRTALDVASCVGQGIAAAAAPVLGQVAGIVLGSTPQADAESALRQIGVERGMGAVLCAIDRLIGDLGGPPPAHAGRALSTAQVAASRAVALRASLAQPM